MGFRQTLAKWLGGTDGDRSGRAAAGGHPRPVLRSDADDLTAVIGDPVPAPPLPGLGGVILGDATHRLAPVALPQFYVPGQVADTHRPPPAPALSPTATAAAANGAPVAPDTRPSPETLRAAEHLDHAQLRAAWDLVRDRPEQLVSLFYAELFLRLGDEALAMFPASMEQQRRDFGEILVQWVVADQPEALRSHLDQLGADHRKYAVEPRHYDVAGVALVDAWKTLAGERLTPRMLDAVTASYARLASIMIDGALAQRAQPATWGARIVAHRRVTDDFAVLTVQPDAPYFFKPGQYLTLELAGRPKLWRQMSIASAPRPDNTFDLHARAVNATGVSAALVRYTAVGDRLRLGPPRGNDLVVEPGTVPQGLLCVASGTGAAPIAAVVESILGWPQMPENVFAYVGGRTRRDVLPILQLTERIREQGATSAHLECVLSDDPAFPAHHGRVEAVVPRLHDWARLGVDVFVSGPASMMSATIGNLRAAGVARSKIHFDQYDAVA